AVPVSDYQEVTAGDLLVQLRDDDFRAQVQQAEAAVLSAEDSLIQNQRQMELQDSRIAQAEEGIHSADAQIAAAQAGIEAAESAMRRAVSTRRRPTRSARNWNDGGRRRFSPTRLQRIRQWNRWLRVRRILARSLQAARMT